MVKAGISGSSILDTDARTSGKGLSSSSIASKSNSILEVNEGEGQYVSEGCGDDMSEERGRRRGRIDRWRGLSTRLDVWRIHMGTRSWLHVKVKVARKTRRGKDGSWIDIRQASREGGREKRDSLYGAFCFIVIYHARSDAKRFIDGRLWPLLIGPSPYTSFHVEIFFTQRTTW